MRIAVVSDIHGNLTAFEAVLADLRNTSPDLILHGGDLADSGSSPAEVVDRIRALGWPGVVGNTDEMLAIPESLVTFVGQSPLFPILSEMAAAAREALGEERLAWLRNLPRSQVYHPMALVHASPESPWRAPMHIASDIDLAAAYGPLAQPIAVYGHIHRPYLRLVGDLLVANTGSVSLSHDGDSRASYLLLDDSTPEIRRIEYDLDAELKALSASRLPHSDWIGKMLTHSSFQMP